MSDGRNNSGRIENGPPPDLGKQHKNPQNPGVVFGNASRVQPKRTNKGKNSKHKDHRKFTS